jgi:transcriptional regulatory protein RtcR
VPGANCDLTEAVRAGRLREDLPARLKQWTFRLPCLSDRGEDIEPNLDDELSRHAERNAMRISFNREARTRYLISVVARIVQ